MKLWYVSTADVEAYAFAEDLDGAVALVAGAAEGDDLWGREVKPALEIYDTPAYFVGDLANPWVGTPTQPLLLSIRYLDKEPGA